MSKNRMKMLPKIVHFSGVLSILFALFLFTSEAHADTRCTPFTRWQAVRFTRFEGPELFRIDVLELTDRNPPQSDVEGVGFLVDDSERAQTVGLMLQNLAKRGVESAGREPLGGTQLLDESLFVSKKGEGTVKLWGRNLSWHRYSFFAPDGSFDMKFVSKNEEISVLGEVNGQSRGLSKLERIAFRKEYKGGVDKWKSWGVDVKNGLNESADYSIEGMSSVR